MGSEPRHRLACGSRCWYAALVTFGFALATVTIVTMMFILWCYVGLVSFQLSENQRRAIVNYPFTTAIPSPLVANLTSSNKTFQDPRESYGSETASNNISKSPTVATTMINRGSSRGESALTIDKRKQSSRVGDMAKGDFATRDRSVPSASNRTLGENVGTKDNSTGINPAEQSVTILASSSSGRINPPITQRPSSHGSASSVVSSQSSRNAYDDPDDRIHARRVLSADTENRPIAPPEPVGTGSGRRDYDKPGGPPEISPSRVDTRDGDDRRTRKPIIGDRDYEEGRPASRNPPSSSRDDAPKPRRSDDEYDRDLPRRSSSRDDGYDDRDTRSRYDRDRDGKESYSGGDRRVYSDEDKRPVVRDSSRSSDSSRDDRYKDDDRYRDRSRDDRYRDDRRQYDDRDRVRPADDRKRDRDDKLPERDLPDSRSRIDDDRNRRRDDDRYKDDDGYRSRDDDRYRPRDDRDRSRDDDRYRSGSDRRYDDDRYVDRVRDDKDELVPKARPRVRDDDDGYRSSDSRVDDREYRETRRPQDPVDRKQAEGRPIGERRDYDSDRDRPERYKQRYDDRDDYRNPSRDYGTDDRISPTKTRDDTYSSKSTLVDRLDDKRPIDYDLDRRERVRSSSSDRDTPALLRPSSSARSEGRDRDDDYRRPSRYDDDDDDRILPSRVRDGSYVSRSSVESRSKDDSRYDDRRDVRGKDDRYDDDDDRYRYVRKDDSRGSSSRRPVDEDLRSSEPRLPDTKSVDRDEVVLDRRSYSSEDDDEYRRRNRPSSRYDYPDDRSRDRRPDDKRIDEDRYVRRGSDRKTDDDEYESRSRGDYGTDRQKYRDREDTRYDKDDDRYVPPSDRQRKDDLPPRKYDRSEDERPPLREDPVRERGPRPVIDPEERPSGSRSYPSYSDSTGSRRYDDDRDSPRSRDRKEEPIPVRSESRPSSRDRDMPSPVSSSSTREQGRVVTREKRFQSTHGNSQVSSVSRVDAPAVEDKPHMSAKDVIEAAMRQPTSSADSKEVFYPVYDPRVSSMKSPEVIAPSERRGSTLTAKKKK